MTAFSFDSNILIDALNGHEGARAEIARATQRHISRVTWIEVLSKVEDGRLPVVSRFLDRFQIDELDAVIARRAAALRRERQRLKLADSVILASAQEHGRILITRNTKDFPVAMPGIRVPYTL
ncbi:PIN domain-containing protein [Sphingomonas sp. RP10(2022)]|uniref:Ribonuclease VapC n=1 Tax=Sphingomonas liriopis TaxID=2949094 RepID=A0A9X2KQW2_9SPHN|nr:PIN domain-containing protein [Sphingomonas liriopis]